MKQIIFDPHPRTRELIFSDADWQMLSGEYQIVEPPSINDHAWYEQNIGEAVYIIGQPPLDKNMLDRAVNLRAVFNVESNFLDNMDYRTCFERGIHVLATSPVFALPVAELGLGMALSLLRGIASADHDFKIGSEVYGLEGNLQARLLSNSQVGLIGYGDLGTAIHALLRGFNCKIKVYDPWLPASLISASGAEPVDLDTVLSESDVIFIVAAATDTNQGALAEGEFAKMQKGVSVVLLSRANVVDFNAMINAVKNNHIRVATDVYPVEPVPADDPIRNIPGLLLSAHRAGALDSAFKEMGRIVIEDIKLLDKGLAPKLCKRAERETVKRFRSMPVEIN